MTVMYRFVIILLLLLSSQSWAQSIPSLTVASPSDGTVVQPGQTLSVEVKGSNLPVGGQEVLVGDLPIGILQAQLAGNDLTFQLTVPSDVQPGTYALWSVVRASSGDTLSPSVVIKVLPNYQLTALAFDKGVLALVGPGKQSVLSTFGYTAGKRQILDNQFLSFSSADPSTATVDANGVVRAIAAGKTTISAAYGTASGSILVMVGSSLAGSPTTAAPIISPPTGSFAAPFTATITDTTPGSTIYYTLDGSTPTTTSKAYSGALSVTATETIQAIAIASGYTQSPVASVTFTIKIPVAASPTFSPAAGIFTSVQTVTIADATAGAAVYYTTNGMTPTTSSSLYSGPITIGTTETVQSVAVASGYADSTVASAAYIINLPQDFSLGLSASSLSIAPGQSGTVTASVASVNGFNQPVSFACSGLPSGTTCTFSPATLTPNGTISGTTAVTISTSTKAELSSGNPSYELAGVVAGLSLLFAGQRFRKLGRTGVLLLLLIGIGSAVSCGGGNAPSQTSATTATVSINASSGSLTHAASLKLTVQ